MGSPNAATISDLLSAIMPEACLFLGKCGGVETKIKGGDILLPVAAVRGEGTSNDYFPPEVPALPHFMLQRVVSTTLKNHCSAYWAGVVYTTNRRVWEHDASFKDYLRKIRVSGVEMECATLFSCANYNYLPMGGVCIAFKSIDYSVGIFQSPFIGLKNIDFLFRTPDALLITRNTLLYNLMFIVISIVMGVIVAVFLNEIRTKLCRNLCQTALLLPQLVSCLL